MLTHAIKQSFQSYILSVLVMGHVFIHRLHNYEIEMLFLVGHMEFAPSVNIAKGLSTISNKGLMLPHGLSKFLTGCCTHKQDSLGLLRLESFRASLVRAKMTNLWSLIDEVGKSHPLARPTFIHRTWN